MSTKLKAGTATSGAVIDADTTGILELQSGSTPTTAITIDVGQRTTFPTTIAVGAATPSTSGAGITFPATQSASTDANTLDDYEEGSWTPSVGGNTTYAVQAGKYVKIGQSVTCWFDIAITTLGTGSANSFIGFPFTSISQANPQGMGGSVGYFATSATAVSSIFIRIDPASTGVSISATVGNLASVGTYAIFQNGTRFTGTITYQSAS